MDLPKGEELRGQVNMMKVELFNMMESIKEQDWENMSEKEFPKKMAVYKKKALGFKTQPKLCLLAVFVGSSQISDSKLLIVQARAVIREKVPWR